MDHDNNMDLPTTIVSTSFCSSVETSITKTGIVFLLK